jgi:hypothetical protein
MTDDLTSAAAGLARADRATRRMHDRARWLSNYFAVFGLYIGSQTLLLGLVQPLALRMTIFAVCLPVVLGGLIFWARRQGAVPRGRLRRLWAWLGSSLLYGGALIAGTPRLEGQVWYWVPAAIVVALPLGVASWLERRG